MAFQDPPMTETQCGVQILPAPSTKSRPFERTYDAVNDKYPIRSNGTGLDAIHQDQIHEDPFSALRVPLPFLSKDQRFKTVDEMKRDHFTIAFRTYKFDYEKTARALGITGRTARIWAKQWDLMPKDE